MIFYSEKNYAEREGNNRIILNTNLNQKNKSGY